MAEIHILDCVTRLDLPADRVIDAIPKDMDDIVVVGFDADGEFYFASNKANGGDILWLIEKAKKVLMDL